MELTPTTAPELLAVKRGSHRCYYCGAACSVDYPSSQFVKKSFTSRDTVCGGEFVCAGCVAAMDESAEIALPDGTLRSGQKTRCYSWLLTQGKRIAATKAHLDWLRGVCLSPPEPPYAIILSDSGQKHLIYRGVVCHSAVSAVATLEGARIDYTPAELSARLELCKRIVAATGKPALKEPLSPSAAMRIIAHHGDETIVTTWQAVREEPLSQLAGWLCPNKQECLNEFPSPA